MTKPTRFFATCLLILSMSAIALADGEGGVMQGPPAPVPPPSAESSADCSSIEAATAAQPVQDSTINIATTAEALTVWLAMSIL
jgi:hypothetical protein